RHFSVLLASHPQPRRSFPTRRSSDLRTRERLRLRGPGGSVLRLGVERHLGEPPSGAAAAAGGLAQARRLVLRPDVRRRRNPVQRSEEHTSELQSREKLVCRLLLEKKT